MQEQVARNLWILKRDEDSVNVAMIPTPKVPTERTAGKTHGKALCARVASLSSWPLETHFGGTIIRGVCLEAGVGRGLISLELALTYLLSGLARFALWSWRALQEAEHVKVCRGETAGET